MSQIFTPRTPPTPTPTSSPPQTSPRSVTRKTVWQTWKPRIAQAVQLLLRGARTLTRSVTRYVRGLSRTQRYQHMAIVLGVFLLIVLFNLIFSRHPATTTQGSETANGAQLPKETPSFSTILPSGASASKYGGWTRVSPSDRNAVYAYTDTLAEVAIIVSEQPIPDSFKSDQTGSIQKLAESYSADRTFDTDGTTVYIGKSSKGPQSLIFTEHGLLVLIKSSSTVSDDQWKTYIKSLR